MNNRIANTRFERAYPIRFSHCDLAGIVFFPQYLVLFNQLVEDWFAEGLNITFSELLQTRRIGLPTVHLECNFAAISRMGESVLFGLAVERLGTKSLTLELTARLADEIRVQARQVLVFTNLDTHQSISVPDKIRATLSDGATT